MRDRRSNLSAAPGRAPTRRRVTAALVLLMVTAPVLGPNGTADAATGTHVAEPTTVKMIHFTFDPPTVTIAAGATVTWTYDEVATDPQPGCESPEFRLVPAVSCPGHSTTAVAVGSDGTPLWDSGVHRADGFPYSHTFTTPGTYAYYCVVHGGPNPNNPLTHMDGTIVVTAADTTAVDASGTNNSATATGGQVAGADATADLPVTGGTNRLALSVAMTLGALAALSLRRRAR